MNDMIMINNDLGTWLKLKSLSIFDYYTYIELRAVATAKMESMQNKKSGR